MNLATTNTIPNVIRARPQPRCYLCGSLGEPLYRDLRDRLFGSYGEWHLTRCTRTECGLLWLDPMPIEDDIGKAYEDYVTHGTARPEGQVGSQGSAVKRILGFVYRFFERLTPLHAERQRSLCAYLDDKAPGRLLEVGCGDGSLLARMRAIGWQVEGQEVDPQAVSLRRRSDGIQVHLGQLVDLHLPRGSFDAVVMHHVVEHLHDPRALLVECRRLLKDGGTLVVVTPNTESYGHRRYASSWFALDPPRHLHLFSPKTLRTVAAQAGFTECELWTTAVNSESVFLGSIGIQRAGRYDTRTPASIHRHAEAAILRIWERAILSFHNVVGEECVLRAKKCGPTDAG